MARSRNGILMVLVGAVLLNVVLGYLLLEKPKKVEHGLEEMSVEQLSAKFPMLSKRILIENQNDLIVNFIPLRKKLREMVGEWGGTFAFYFEYLPTGVSIGVNEKEEYNPQSLIKVPIVMAYYYYRERTGLSMDPVVTIAPHQVDDGSGSLWMVGEGATLKLSQAVELALKESDNTATNVLADSTPLEDYKAVYEGLDIDFPEKNSDLRLSVKQYSSIMRSLYLSSILNKEDSQEILKILAQTIFKDKLPAGVPDGVTIAHKVAYFGEELHKDCGIVYVPLRPYLLCMISKSNEKEAGARMKRVSKEVYDYISLVNAK